MYFIITKFFYCVTIQSILLLLCFFMHWRSLCNPAKCTIFMLQKYNLKYHQNPGPPWSVRVAYDAPPNPLVEFAELHAHLPLRGGTNPLTCAPPAILQAPPSAIPTLRG